MALFACNKRCSASFAFSMLLATAAQAQTAPQLTPPLPAAAPAASAFATYKPYSDEPITNWRVANDNVARIGGWREYAKQAQQPDTTAQPAQAQPAPAQPAQAQPAQALPGSITKPKP